MLALMTASSRLTALRYVDLSSHNTIAAILSERAALTPDAQFVTFDGEAWTFAEMLAKAEQAAAALVDVGVRPRDTVALMLPNSLEFLQLWFGTAIIGAILVPINTGLRGDGLRYIVEHCDSRLLIVDAPLLSVYDAAMGDSTSRPRAFVRGATCESKSVTAWLDGAYASTPHVVTNPTDVASILYTSGTTGRPKGVINCHHSYAAAGRAYCQDYVKARVDDVFYTSLPLFHINAQMLSTIGSIVSGLPLVLAPRFSASGFIDDLHRHNATVFNYIGGMLTMIAKQPPHEDDARNPARLTVGGAAPADLWPEFERRFGLSVLEIYGLTETATFCLANPPDDIRVGKLGLPVQWAEVRVEHPDGTETDVGDPGEIVIRSKEPNVLFKGYYKDEVATAAAMRGGWFHSGDRGVRDEDGYFAFLDRIKDVIRRRGENISSWEIERIANSHPEIAESAAVGVPSELGEEEIMLVVALRAGAAPHPGELLEFCAARMAAFMVPRFVKFRVDLPKTATERVRKVELRQEGILHAWDAAAGSWLEDTEGAT
jgi:carnitine-CoA ligase